MATPEGRVKAKLDKMLKAEGLWYYSPQAGPYGRVAIPDRIVILYGRFLGIEAKADAKKKPTKLQEIEMRKIEAAGGKCFLVYDDATIEAVRQFIVDARNRGPAGVSHSGP